MSGQDDNGGNGGPEDFVGRFLCWLGFHDYFVVEVTFGFGGAGNVEKIECRRCGDVRQFKNSQEWKAWHQYEHTKDGMAILDDGTQIRGRAEPWP